MRYQLPNTEENLKLISHISNIFSNKIHAAEITKLFDPNKTSECDFQIKRFEVLKETLQLLKEYTEEGKDLSNDDYTKLKRILDQMSKSNPSITKLIAAIQIVDSTPDHSSRGSPKETSLRTALLKAYGEQTTQLPGYQAYKGNLRLESESRKTMQEPTQDESMEKDYTGEEICETKRKTSSLPT